MGWIGRFRRLLFGNIPAHGGSARERGWRFLALIEADALDTLDDQELMLTVRELLTIRQLREPLHGNARFLQDVTYKYFNGSPLTPRQRQGILNVLERAYPHNLAVTLRNTLGR